MPTISRFYGILIYMNPNDHRPPHFHVRYAEHRASVIIATGDLIEGNLPTRALRLVQEWWQLHQAELEENWRRRENQLPVLPIDPL
ncbi:MAG: DUF4160 domain-containing protein [Verrucomicrobiota bacterium]|nr:DUF4160 domain-containing protein [Verrucomicrobiota bacterium]